MLWGLIEIEMPTAFKLPLRRNKYDDILKDCTWLLSEAGCCLEPHLIMDDDDDEEEEDEEEEDDVVLRMVMGTMKGWCENCCVLLRRSVKLLAMSKKKQFFLFDCSPII